MRLLIRIAIEVSDAHSELLRILADQQVRVLFSIVLISSGVIWHKIVIEVVVASHSHKEYAPSDGFSHLPCPYIVTNLIQRVLEVSDLLIERYATHLIKSQLDFTSKIIRMF